MIISKSLALAFVLLAAVEGARLPDVPNCKQKDEYWKGGSIYHYSYETNAHSRTPKSGRDTGVKINCDVELASAGQCRYRLTTTNCGLFTLSKDGHEERHEDSDAFKDQMATNSVQFLMSHGDVHEVIVSRDEPTSVLNIKRGIISALQGSRLKRSTTKLRTDVLGTCLTDYSVSSNYVRYSRTGAQCNYPSRHDWELSPSSLIWNMTFLHQWAGHNYVRCTHKLTEDALETSECYEDHHIKDDLESSNLRTTTSEQRLQLKNKQQEKVQYDRNLPDTLHTDIIYEWEETPRAASGNYKEKAYKIVDEMVTSTLDELRPNTIELFDNLVYSLRSAPELIAFTQGVWNCEFSSKCNDIQKELSRAYVRDALVTCNTENCVKALSWLATNDYLSSKYLDILLLKWTKNIVRRTGYIEAVYDICKAKPSRTCYLSLSSIIHTYSQLQPTRGAKLPSVITKSVELISQAIPKNCIVEEAADEEDIPEERLAVEKIILALKSIGNLGDVAILADNSLLGVIESCIKNEVNPHNISVEAIKSLRRVGVRKDATYRILMDIIRNKHNSAEKRITAYIALTRYHQYEKVYDDLADILKKDDDNQLGNYVRTHMNNVVKHNEHGLDELKVSIRKAYQHHSDIYVQPQTKSLISSRYEEKSKQYDLVNAINVFGYESATSTIFETSSFLPQHVVSNLTTYFAGKTFNSATISAALHGLEPYLEFLVGANTGGKKTLRERYNELSEKDFNLYDLIRSSNYKPHFDHTIEQRLTDIHNSVVHDYAKELPSGSLSIKRHGDELAYTSIGLLKAKFYDFLENDFGRFDWEQSHSLRFHRIIRFLEAYHQIPLVSGLPLKYKSVATAALSIRLEGKVDPFSFFAKHPPTLDAKWDFEPSGALNFVNKVIISVPQITKFGARVSTTLYRSRERAGSVNYENNQLSITIKAPHRPQELFTLNREHHLIHNSKLEKNTLPVTKKEGCLSDEYSGLKLCQSLSNARSKSLYEVFASDVYYRLWLEMTDKGLREYKFVLKNLSPEDGSSKAYAFLFSAPGTKWQRKVEGRYNRNLKTNEFDFQVVVPEKPHFKFQGSRKQKPDGYVTDVNIQLVKDKPIIFHAETSKTENSNSANVLLKCSDRSYIWKRVERRASGSYEIDHHLVYDSPNQQTYLHHILPDVFWESSSKASLHLHIGGAKKILPGGLRSSSDNYIKLPKTILELKTLRVADEDKHNAFHVNLTRRKLPSEEVESLIHFLVDHTEEGGNDEFKRYYGFQLLIPQVRWVFYVKRVVDPVDNKNTIVLKREKATDESLEVTDATPVDKWDVTLKFNHHNTSRVRGDVYPTPRERDLEIILLYPRDGAQQTVSYKGTLINNEGVTNAITSFQSDAKLKSTYHQLELHGKSDYKRTVDGIKLNYHSDINNLRTGNTATYDLNFNFDRNLPIELTQNYKSKRLTFREALLIKRTDTGIEGNLDISSSCPEWDFLDLVLKQRFVFTKEKSWETTEFKHKYVDVDVKGEYKAPYGSDNRKEFDIRSKNDIFPSMKWHFRTKDFRIHTAHIEYPELHRNIYSTIEVQPDKKGLTLNVSHDHDGSNKIEDVDVRFLIVKPDLVELNYTYDPQSIKAALQEYADRFEKLVQAWYRIKNDPDHPMNKYLRPIVKTTLGDYERELARRFVENCRKVGQALHEAGERLKPLYAPAAEVIRNIKLSFVESEEKSDHDYSEDQYALIKYIEDYFRNLLREIRNKYDDLTSRAQSGTKALEHPFQWDNLGELPVRSPRFYRMMNRVPYTEYNMWRTGSREALLYAGNFIYTFDGRHYTFPGFANDECTFLLAHNFVTREFSLLVQREKLHLLLPYVAITVEKNGKVSLNNGKKAENLPINKEHVTVARVGQKIKVKTEHGINLDINPDDSVVSIDISIWHHNKTLGLLGNNDDEPMNDFKMLNGEVTSDVYQFLSSYELSHNPECVDRSKLETHESCIDHPYECNYNLKYEKNVFSSSNLYMCFDVVDPEPFYQACVGSEIPCGKRNMCSTAAAYATICKKHGIPVGRPVTC